MLLKTVFPESGNHILADRGEDVVNECLRIGTTAYDRMLRCSMRHNSGATAFIRILGFALARSKAGCEMVRFLRDAAA
jgi:hypothetical protein